jgi:hypothetical protein
MRWRLPDAMEQENSFPRLANALFSCDVHAESRVVFDLHIEPVKVGTCLLGDLQQNVQ